MPKQRRHKPSSPTLLGEPLLIAVDKHSSDQFPGGLEVIHQDPKTSLWNVPYQYDCHFVARDEILLSMREGLWRDDSLASTQVISGLGGIGKTQLAVQFAYSHSHLYKAVFWVSSDCDASIINSYREIANIAQIGYAENSINDLVEHIRKWLLKNPSWLIIYDNACDPEVLKRYWFTVPHGHRLITSWHTDFRIIGAGEAIRLTELNPDEALSLLCGKANSNNAKPEELVAARFLAKELGYFPMFLEQAALFVRQHSLSWADYLVYYKEHKSRISTASCPDFPFSVGVTWRLHFDNLSRASFDLMRLLAFFHPDGILEDIIVQAAKCPMCFDTHLTRILTKNPLGIRKLMSPLLNHSLLRYDQGSRKLFVHNLVQRFIISTMKESQQKKWAERVIHALYHFLIDAEDRISDAKYLQVFPQLVAISQHIERLNLNNKHTRYLLRLTGRIMLYLGRYTEAEASYKKAIALSHQDKSKDVGIYRQMELSRLFGGLGLVYMEDDKASTAYPYLEKALQIANRELGPTNPNTSYYTHLMALNRHLMGRCSEATQYYMRTINILQLAGESDSMALAKVFHNMGNHWYRHNDYRKALSAYTDALRIYEIHQVNHERAMCHCSIADCESGLDNIGKAHQLYLRALDELNQSGTPEQHHDFGHVLNALGCLYIQQGKMSNARHVLNQAYGIRRESFGDDHWKSSTPKYNLQRLKELQRFPLITWVLVCLYLVLYAVTDTKLRTHLLSQGLIGTTSLIFCGHGLPVRGNFFWIGLERTLKPRKYLMALLLSAMFGGIIGLFHHVIGRAAVLFECFVTAGICISSSLCLMALLLGRKALGVRSLYLLLFVAQSLTMLSAPSQMAAYTVGLMSGLLTVMLLHFGKF